MADGEGNGLRLAGRVVACSTVPANSIRVSCRDIAVALVRAILVVRAKKATQLLPDQRSARLVEIDEA